jgi:hypothetical protein
MMSQKTGKFVCYGARRRELSINFLAQKQYGGSRGARNKVYCD